MIDLTTLDWHSAQRGIKMDIREKFDKEYRLARLLVNHIETKSEPMYVAAYNCLDSRLEEEQFNKDMESYKGYGSGLPVRVRFMVTEYRKTHTREDMKLRNRERR